MISVAPTCPMKKTSAVRPVPTHRSTGATKMLNSATHATQSARLPTQNALENSTRSGSVARWWRLVLRSCSSAFAIWLLDVCRIHDVISRTNRYAYVPGAERM